MEHGAYYYKKFAPDTAGMYEVIETEENRKAKEEMRKILLPLPEYDVNGNVTNEAALPKYYVANRSTKDGDVFTGERSIINIKTNADAIIRAIDEIYRTEAHVDKSIMAGDTETSDKLSKEQYAEMKENSGKDYLSDGGNFMPKMDVKMVADIVEFFGSNAIIDPSEYFSQAGQYADLKVNWFLEEAEGVTTNIGTGNPATITTQAGTNILSPITGEVTAVTSDTIEITKYGTYEEAVEEGLNVVPADKVPLIIIRLKKVDNISVSVGQTVTAGSTNIGKVGSDGKIEFSHLRGDLTIEEATTVNEELTIAQAAKNSQFALPLAPGTFVITSEFGPRVNPYTHVYQEAHGALDFGGKNGSLNNHPIYASADGVAVVPGYSNSYGNYMKIDHGGGYETLYAHMIGRPIVRSGDEIRKGQVIGYVGSTGWSTGPHLHFEVRVNGTRVDPRNYIGQFLE